MTNDYDDTAQDALTPTAEDVEALRQERSERIRELNDDFRANDLDLADREAVGDIIITHGVEARGEYFIERAVDATRTFSDFNADNDPYGEHDFGELLIGDINLFWKIDYYDKEMDVGSPDPSDPNETRRVLTILLAEEY